MVANGLKLMLIFMMACFSMSLVMSASETCLCNGLTFLGSTDGKSYYLERVQMNWAMSKQRCDGAGMQLATITSSSQLSLLKRSYDATEYFYYWLGARDSQTPSQFVWDHNNASLDSSIFSGSKPLIEGQTCVTYKAESATEADFYLRPCREEICFTLCEIIHNQNM